MLAVVMLFPFAMMLAAFCDLLSMTIPNRLNAALALAFLCLAPLAGFDLQLVSLHLLAGFGVLLVTFGCFAAGWMGGGDAKLMAATALWLGPTPLLVEYMVVSALFGGALTLALLQARAVVLPFTGLAFLDRLLRPETGIPYGIALGLGGLVVYPDSPLFQAAMRALAAG